MVIDPAELSKKEFRLVFRGFDPREVRTFLLELAGELEGLLAVKDALSLKIAGMEEEIEEFKQMERVLKQTLTQGHGTAEQLRQRAVEDSKRVREEAKQDAEKTLATAQDELEQLRSTIQSLRGQKMAFLEEMENLFKSYGKIVERLKKETQENATTN